MLPFARAFDSFRSFFVALLPTIALTFGANALIGDGCSLVPADPSPAEIAQAMSIDSTTDASPPAESVNVDAAVTNATLILQLDGVEIEWDILDRTESLCPYHSRHMHYGRLQWHEDW